MIYEFTKFTTLATSMLQSEAIIEKEKSSMLNFGISYLDDAFVGISQNDLILIGGRSGSGKTEISIQIAFNNAIKGIPTYYFALEAEKHEMGMRLLYKTLAQKHFQETMGSKEFISYDRWIAGKLSEKFYAQTKEIAEAFQSIDQLRTRYVTSDYTIENFVSDMDEVKDYAKLVVLDHLHYFELDSTSNENAEYKRIVKTIRTHCLENNIPVILVSHLRKLDVRNNILAPDQEDFHGSSDIVKIATKAFTIAGGGNKAVFDPHGDEVSFGDDYLCFMKAVKSRRNGSVTFKTAAMSFNPSQNCYSQDYILGSPVFHEGQKRFGMMADDESKSQDGHRAQGDFKQSQTALIFLRCCLIAKPKNKNQNLKGTGGSEIANDDVRVHWQNFHFQNCSLQMLCTKCHIEKTKLDKFNKISV